MLTLADDTLVWYLRMNRALLVANYRDMEADREMISSRIPGLREKLEESRPQDQKQLADVLDAASRLGLEESTPREIDFAMICTRVLDMLEDVEDGVEGWDALVRDLVEDPFLDPDHAARAVREMRRYRAVGQIISGHQTLSELEDS